MPTTITKTVKPNGGGDYASLSAALIAEAAIRSNLVGNDEILALECYAGLDTTAVSVSGFTTDATRYIRIYTASGQGHTGFYDSTKYRLEVAGARAFVIGSATTKHIRFEQLQAFVSGTNGSLDAYFESSTITAPSEIRYINCIAKASFSGASGQGAAFRTSGTASDDATIVCIRTNCIADGFRNPDNDDDSFGWNSSAHTNNKEFNYNCLAINCDRGFRDRANIRYKNCAAIGCENGWLPTSGPHASSTNNASSQNADARGTNALHKVAVLFTDPLVPDYRLHNSDTGLKGLGVDLSADADFAFSTDITGATRSAPWCVGPSEADGAATQAVRWCHAGGITATSASIVAHLHQAAAVVHLRYGTDATLATYNTATAASGANNNATFALTGLTPDTLYYYVVEIGGTVYTDRLGRFRSHPSTGTFRFAVAGDLDTGVGGEVVRLIDAQDPLFFLMLGDHHYEDITTNNLSLFRAAYETAHLVPTSFELYHHRQVEYIWDDHDYAGPDSDGTSTARPAAQDAYRENVAHYDLPAGAGQFPIYHSYVVGRVRFVITDLRSARTPKSTPDTGGKTMMGAIQKQWFKDELLAAKAASQLVIWACTVPWITSPTDFDDSWQGYQNERRELADFMQTNGITNLVRLEADVHMAAIDDGSNDLFTSDGVGNRHVTVHAAPLSQNTAIGGGTYSSSQFASHSGQYALITVADSGGPTLTVTAIILWGSTQLASLVKVYTLGEPLQVGELSTYLTLQDAIKNWLNRADLADQIPTFIKLFEARARRELHDWLRSTITASNVIGDLLLPVTVSDVLSVNINDGVNGLHNFALEVVDKQHYQSLMEFQSFSSVPVGRVCYPDVDVEAGTTTLRFWPPVTAAAPIANLKVEVVKLLPSLSADQETNALLRDAPDVYLAGSCAEAAKFLQHDERVPMWKQERDEGFQSLRLQTQRRLYAGLPRSLRLPVVFP